jgi:hypothetical protein
MNFFKNKLQLESIEAWNKPLTSFICRIIIFKIGVLQITKTPKSQIGIPSQNLYLYKIGELP